MKKHFLIISLLISIYNFSFAQKDTVFTIKGRVLDSESNEPLEFASVYLSSKLDSSIFYGTITDKNGKFLFNQVKRDNYLLNISFFGFEKEYINIQENDKSLVNVGDISLSIKALEISEIVVTAKKNKYQSLLNKEIFAPDSATLAKATNGLDVLSKAPYVTVNKAFNTVSVVGKNNTLILVNGAKKDEKDIKMLLPEDIEKVEVITASSSKYDAEVDAVINIILKKKVKQGLIIAPEIDYSGKTHNESSVGLQYGFEKLRFFVDYYFHYRKYNTDSNSQRISSDKSTNYKYILSSESVKPLEYGHMIGYGCDYFINSKNTLNFAGRFDIVDYDKIFNNYVNSFVNDSLINSYNYKRYNKGVYKMTNYSLFYEHKFKSPEQLFSINFNFYNLSSNSNVSSKNFYDNINLVDLASEISQQSDMSKQSSNLQIDYSHPFCDNLILETGYNFYYMKNNHNFIRNNNQKEILRYKDLRNSLFFQMKYTAKKIGLLAGIRFEQTNDEINDTSSVYHHFLPFSSLMYNFNSHSNLRLSYFAKLTRPQLWQLNPFLYQNDSLNYNSGNVFLKPAVNHDISLSYGYRKNDLFLSAETYVKIVDGVIAKDIKVENNIKYETLKNIGFTNIYGIKIFVSKTFFEKLNIGLSANGYYVKVTDNETFNGGFSYSAFLSADVSLPKKIDIFSGFQVPDKTYYLQGYSQNNISLVYVGIGKSLFNDNGYLKLMYIYPFSKIETDVYEKFDNYSYEENTKINSTMLRIVFSYYFHKGLKIKSLERENYMEKDK